MSFRPALILATVLAAWSAAAGAETIKIGVTPEFILTKFKGAVLPSW